MPVCSSAKAGGATGLCLFADWTDDFLFCGLLQARRRSHCAASHTQTVTHTHTPHSPQWTLLCLSVSLCLCLCLYDSLRCAPLPNQPLFSATTAHRASGPANVCISRSRKRRIVRGAALVCEFFKRAESDSVSEFRCGCRASMFFGAGQSARRKRRGYASNLILYYHPPTCCTPIITLIINKLPKYGHFNESRV